MLCGNKIRTLNDHYDILVIQYCLVNEDQVYIIHNSTREIVNLQVKKQLENIDRLYKCIELEEKEQISRYALDQQQSLKNLKTDGLAIHPIRVTRKAFGYADYPEISFRIPFPIESRNFRDGSAIECFCQGETPIKGILLQMDGKQGEFRLFAPDFPDWIEDDQVGIKLAPDSRTTDQMKKAISAIEKDKRLFDLFEQIHSENTTSSYHWCGVLCNLFVHFKCL